MQRNVAVSDGSMRYEEQRLQLVRVHSALPDNQDMQYLFRDVLRNDMKKSPKAHNELITRLKLKVRSQFDGNNFLECEKIIKARLRTLFLTAAADANQSTNLGASAWLLKARLSRGEVMSSEKKELAKQFDNIT